MGVKSALGKREEQQARGKQDQKFQCVASMQGSLQRGEDLLRKGEETCLAQWSQQTHILAMILSSGESELGSKWKSQRLGGG